MRLTGCLWLSIALNLVSSWARADVSVTSLHDFTAFASGNTVNSDGAKPYTPLVQDSGGTLYGGTSTGGQFGTGTVFKLDVHGTLTTLHDFTATVNPPGSSLGTNTDGKGVVALVLDSSGNLYGAATLGGVNGNGLIFRLSAGVFTPIHTFSAFAANAAFTNDDGAFPSDLILGKDGSLYGTASGGGKYSTGTVFKITPAGDFTVLYSFGSVEIATKANADGGNPLSIIEDAAGTFYGATDRGGPGGTGVIFKLTADGTLTVLHAFSSCGQCYSLSTNTSGQIAYANADGVWPSGIVLARDGNLYGTASAGGSAGYGTIFRISPTGAFTLLYNFTGLADGGLPSAGLTEGADGVFFGRGANNIFSTGTSSSGTSVLYSFTGVAADFPNTAPLLPSKNDLSGTFYLVNAGGGANGNGNIGVLNLGGAIPPVFNPAGGTYSAPQTVTISEASPGTTIYYTTDGSMPTPSSSVYTGPITVSATTTVRAIAAGGGYTSGSVGTSSYTISPRSSGGGGALDSLALLVLTILGTIRGAQRYREAPIASQGR